MSKVTFNPFIEKLSGSFGEIVFRRVGDHIVIAHKPDLHGVQPTVIQLAQRERFRQAVIYGKGVLSTPTLRQPYQLAADRTKKPIMGFLVSDYMVAPVIDSIDISNYTGKIGDKLIVQAHDDFEVTALQVRLLDGSGAEIEKGPALQEPAGSGRWIYVTKVAVTPGAQVQVTVSASDRPGNRADQQALKTV